MFRLIKSIDFKSPLARRLIVSLILFSSIITLVTTGFQLHRDYQRSINAIDNFFRQIEATHVGSLRESLWVYDETQTNEILAGILHGPYLEYASIKNENGNDFIKGEQLAKYTRESTITITKNYGGKTRLLGELHIIANIDNIYKETIISGFFILLSNGIKTFMVAAFMFFIVHILITRHLTAIASYVRQKDITTTDNTLSLERRSNPAQPPDELDTVVHEVNTLYENLFQSNYQLKHDREFINAVLENAGALILVLDHKGRICRFNLACEQLTDFSFEDVKGKYFWEILFTPDDSKTVKNSAFLNLSGDPKVSHRTYTNHWLTKSGEKRLLNWTNTLMLDEHDEIEFMIIIGTDVTEDHMVKDALLASKYILSAYLADFSNVDDISSTDFSNVNDIFSQMLDKLLDITGSEYGFIGEIKTRDNGQRYLMTYSITDIAWNDESRALYDQYGKTGFEFTNLNSLFGITIEHGELVISNDPANDKRRGGLPEGHPALNAYMGIPLLAGENNIGMVGIANREGGYTTTLFDAIKPLVQTLVNIIVAYQNNREQIRIENELRDSEHSLAAAQKIAHVGSWEWNIKSGALKWSDEIYHIFGLQPQQFEATYEAFLNYVHPNDRDAVIEAVNNSLADPDVPYDINHRVVRRDGSERSVHECGVITLDDTGKPLRMLGIVHDITEQVKSSRQLRHFKSTLDQTYDCVFIFKPDTLVFSYVNQGVIEQFGYSYDELMGMTAYDLKPDYNEEEFRAILSPLVYGETDIIHFETTHRHKDGHDIPIEVNLQYLHSENEEARFVGIVRNITERKLAEAELKQYQHHLEELVDARTEALRNAQDELVRKERLATLGNLTATVSHELRNPLGAMRPSLYIIEKITRESNNEKLQSAIQRLNRSITRCDNIIDELLDFTRITELVLQPVALDEWLETVIYEQTLINGIELVYQPGLGNRQVDIDTDRLRRAVINIFENGCHAMLLTDNTTEVIDKARLIIKTQSANDRISILITDTGSGIPDDVMEKIYEPLFSTKGFGVGLGMPTVQQIMKQHGGGIDINTGPAGTAVTLWLPLKQEDEAAA